MTRLKSFADLKANYVPPPKPFQAWDPGAMTVSILSKVCAVLEEWLMARFADLAREKVPLEDISVVHHGGRTQIKVDGKVRFEFKLKVQMDGK
jgi:hypothetical protein